MDMTLSCLPQQHPPSLPNIVVATIVSPKNTVVISNPLTTPITPYPYPPTTTGWLVVEGGIDGGVGGCLVGASSGGWDWT
ncbi:hypothetical protein Tco_1259176 [Tanacetum coccineum]